MIRKLPLALLFIISSVFSFAQTNKNPVLIEVFTETGCGACFENDSAFQAIAKANQEKIAVIDYQCFYMLDTFYQYNKACDERYKYYGLSEFPSAMMNGAEPVHGSAHLSYVKTDAINNLYNKPAQFKIEITSKSTAKGNIHSADIKVKATSLTNCPDKDIRIFIGVIENNIDHEKRYHMKSINGIKVFNHILRAFLPTQNGTMIGPQKPGKVNTVKASYTNDDKEIDFKQVQVVVFVQDMKTKEVLGAGVMKGEVFK